jgi:integrase
VKIPAMKHPTTPLADVVDQYLADARVKLRPSTFQPRASHLRRLVTELDIALAMAALKAKSGSSGGTKPHQATLDDFTKRNVHPIVQALVVDPENPYNARNRAVAARALGTWLAEGLLWYAGDPRVPLSVMAQLDVPAMPVRGRPAFSDQDLDAIWEAASSHPTRPYFHRLVQLLGELGPRSGFELMTLRLADVHLPTRRGDRGYIAIREENTKTPAGVRNVPLEEPVCTGIEQYLRLERGEYQGNNAGDQPLLLTEMGKPYSYSGWFSMRRRFADWLHRLDPSVDYQASRNRSTRANKLREADYEDSEIMDLMGWRTPSMIRRYAGPISLAHFASKPGTVIIRRATPRSLRRTG